MFPKSLGLYRAVILKAILCLRSSNSIATQSEESLLGGGSLVHQSFSHLITNIQRLTL